MNWGVVLARFGLTSARVASPQTLAAASRRQRQALETAHEGVAALQATEATLPPGPERDELRAERLRLEASSERLRMRVEFFRSDRLALGSGFVNGASTSRAGDSLADLTAATSELVRSVEAALERARGSEDPRR